MNDSACINRRELIALAGAAWPMAARGQQPTRIDGTMRGLPSQTFEQQTNTNGDGYNGHAVNGQ